VYDEESEHSGKGTTLGCRDIDDYDDDNRQ
jgi:hypothetical protein